MTDTWNPWHWLRDHSEVRLERVYLDDGLLGLSQPGVIYLDHRQCRRQARSTLGHEAGHHELGHVDLVPATKYERTRRCIAADRWAAERLVTLQALADAIMWCSRGDMGQLAEALNVDEDTLLVRHEMARRDPEQRAYIGRRLADREMAA